MEIIFRHFWIMFIAVTVANAFILKNYSQKYIAEDPTLKKGYDDYFKGILFYGNIPWIIMGIGCLTGLTNGIPEYSSPREMNPVVLALDFSIIILWVLSFRWIYFRNGAEFLERHPGIFFRPTILNKNGKVTARDIKRRYSFILLCWIIMMWIMDFPASNF